LSGSDEINRDVQAAHVVANHRGEAKRQRQWNAHTIAINRRGGMVYAYSP
jgi:hypothetical protein